TRHSDAIRNLAVKIAQKRSLKASLLLPVRRSDQFPIIVMFKDNYVQSRLVSKVNSRSAIRRTFHCPGPDASESGMPKRLSFFLAYVCRIYDRCGTDAGLLLLISRNRQMALGSVELAVLLMIMAALGAF